MLVVPLRGKISGSGTTLVAKHGQQHFGVDTVPLRGSGASEGKFRDKMKPVLRNARFRSRILPVLVLFRGRDKPEPRPF